MARALQGMEYLMYTEEDFSLYVISEQKLTKRVIEVANIIQSESTQGDYDYYSTEFTDACTWSSEEYDNNILVNEGDDEAYSQQVCFKKEFLWSEDLLTSYREEEERKRLKKMEEKKARAKKDKENAKKARLVMYLELKREFGET
jgi:hypothetical protein